ncbi:MAG: hypothetical protein J5J00_10165 [Deltaproteobacteria bacterium]|nr:hypothetical protein [Deltaproteobacteria bacterium]
MASGKGSSFRLFLIVLIVGAFVLVAAHQLRYDYFGTGRKGYSGGGFSLREFFVDKTSAKQEEVMKQRRAGTSGKEAPADARAGIKVNKVQTSGKPHNDELESEDRKQLGNLLDQVAP